MTLFLRDVSAETGKIFVKEWEFLVAASAYAAPLTIAPRKGLPQANSAKLADLPINLVDLGRAHPTDNLARILNANDLFDVLGLVEVARNSIASSGMAGARTVSQRKIVASLSSSL